MGVVWMGAWNARACCGSGCACREVTMCECVRVRVPVSGIAEGGLLRAGPRERDTGTERGRRLLTLDFRDLLEGL